jgi:N-acetylmuramoyl-L-alanine amidase
MIALPLVLGSRGEAVSDLQRRLASLGVVADPAPDTPGVYGPATEAAVRAFQLRYGLDVDGTCNELTWNVLVEVGYRLGDRHLYLRAPMMRGDDVAELQSRLGSLGFDAGRGDGIFGPQTAAALVEFQRNAGLTSDGICGPDTFAALHRLGPERTGAIMVNLVRERERLRTAAPGLDGRRVVLGHTGGLDALTQALHRRVRAAGAHVLTLHHPDGSTQARMANAFEADLFVALRGASRPSNRLAYFRGRHFWSHPGLALAHELGQAVAMVSGVEPDLVGMRLPLLRETRMPTVIAEIGPASLVVVRNEQLADGLVQALVNWAAAPVGPVLPTN